MKKFYIFYHNYIQEPRAQKLFNAAKENGLEPRLVIANDLIFKDGEIFYNDEKISFTPKNLYWTISSTLTLETVAFIGSLNNTPVYPLNNASAYVDKYRTQCFFTSINIPTPSTTLISTTDYQRYTKDLGDYPYVLKKTHSSAGKAVELIYSFEEIEEFIQKNQVIKKVPLKINSFILQKFIPESAGTDYRVLCIKDQVLGIIKRTAKSGFKSNFSLGGSVEYIEKNEEMEKMSRKIMQKSGLFMAGIDFIKSDNGYLAIEINPSPQFEGFEKATGINVANRIIEALL
ncbi:MAG TPA: RimK family alpha-L-glutamate ligase [Candidatus Pacebacteria bacterium]|nr:RimK family alpha-L-glutamate ligase [Candidatus Paceibacterota bacterium]